MIDGENIVEYYYEKLKDSTNPGPILATFMCQLIRKEMTKSHIIMMNKLIKSFGRFRVFFSIVDMKDAKDLEGNLYPLLNAICKRRFEQEHVSSVMVPYQKLDREVTRLENLTEQFKKSRIRIPDFEDEPKKEKDGK